MIELHGKLDFVLKSITDEHSRIQFDVGRLDCAAIEDLQGKNLDIIVKQHRNKRSLDANALLWHICNELGNKLKMSKEEVYFLMLQHYGQSTMISVQSDIQVDGYFKYYVEAGKGTVKGKDFTHYKVYKGSSEYDTEEMSILLDGAVQEAKDQGIQVMSEREISLLKEAWGQ